MDLRPFTKEEQQFAEENHDLVYAFLNEKSYPRMNITMLWYLGTCRRFRFIALRRNNVNIVFQHLLGGICRTN